MYQKQKNYGIWKWVCVFFGTMILFTLLSRAIYQQGTAVVTVQKPTGGTIDHIVKITGKTQQNQDLAVTTMAGLRVGNVLVGEGQQVSKGDVLFTLEEDYLTETITTLKQEMQKQQLTVQDAWAQNSAARQQKENQQAQAAENYTAAVSQAETKVERARQNLQRAKEALENFYQGVSGKEERENTLKTALSEAKSQLSAAQSDLAQLQQQMAQAILDATSQEDLTPEEKAAQEEAIRLEYAPSLSNGEAAVDAAAQAVTAAEAELEAFQQSQNTPSVSEGDLLAAVEQAQEAYDDALAERDTTQTTYSRAIATAELPAGTSNSAQIGQITYDQMAQELEKLEALRNAEGKILAPTDGIVTKCNVQTGEKTTDTTAVLLADLRKGCKFSGLATEEDSRYIGVGDSVVLETSSGKLYKDVTVTTFTEESPGSYRLTAQLPAGNLAPGVNMALRFTKKSQLYAICVPLSALHLDSRNQAYVLVLQEVTGVMGKQLQAKKVNVTVLEQNETTAALAEGAIGTKDSVIVSADRTIDIGSRVRVA